MEPGALVERAAAVAGFDPRAFAWPLARLAGRAERRLEPFDPAGEMYLSAIEQLVSFIDSMR
jgi:hypothetical protein